MSKVKFGILGATRGMNFAMYGLFNHPHAEVAAICDTYAPLMERIKNTLAEQNLHPAMYTDYDEMLESGIDAVIIANFANDHARFAIRALEKGIHVLSEVLPTQTMDEAVRLCDAYEKSGKIYHYAENYCFSDYTLEMKRRYENGDIGELVSAECDFINDCSGRWSLLTRGRRDHWRNLVPSTFYCTHSIGPMVYATGLRPKNVVGMESPQLPYMREHGARSGSCATELMQMENGGFARSLNGNLKRSFLSRIRLIGTKGTMEHCNWGGFTFIPEGPVKGSYTVETYEPEQTLTLERMKNLHAFDRGTAYLMEFFIDAIRGDKAAESMGINLYQALDMSLPGLMAYRSILKGSMPMALPDFRDKAAREIFRGDNTCTDPAVASGDQLQPSCSTPTVEIPDSVYEREAALYVEQQQKSFRMGNY